MKRIIIFVTLSITIVATGFSQVDFSTATGPSFEQLKKAKEKSDEAIIIEKKATDPKEWFKRGILFQDIYEVDIKAISSGMDAQTIKLLLGNPENITKNGLEEEFVYPRVKLFLNNSVLEKWQKTETIVDEPLKEAFNSYEKVIELDTEGKLEKKLKDQFDLLVQQLRANALNDYQNDHKDKALSSFETIINIYDLGNYIEAIDTVNIYYAGVVANECEEYNKAKTYLKRVLDMNFCNEGRVQLELGKIYIATGDTVEAMNIMKEGFKKFPSNEGILVDLINLYIATNQEPSEIIEYLNIAKKQNPTNASLWLVEGTLYEKMKQPEKAMDCYSDAVKVDENYYDGYFNMGVLVFNKAVAIMDKANAEKDFKKYNAFKKEADEKFKESLPHFEKAYEIKPDEKDVLEALKSLYYRLQMNDKYEEVKAKLENK